MQVDYYSFKELFDGFKKQELEKCAIINNSVVKETGNKREPYEPKTKEDITELIQHFENIVYMLKKTSTFKGYSL